MANTLFTLVREQVEDFEQANVEIVPGYMFNQQKTLQQIELYHNSQFESGDTDSEGFKKFFYNINRFPCDIETKATDLDTKDFRFIPDPGEEMATLLLSKEVKNFVRDTYFGTLINEVGEARPKYGSVVVKKTKKGVEMVNIHNIYNDPRAKNMQDGPMLEKHPMTADELRQMPWDKAAIERLITAYQNAGKGNAIVVWEGYRYMKESDLLYNNSDANVYGFFVVGGIELVEMGKNKEIMLEHGELLTAHVIDYDNDWPYRETHRRRIPGRWLGVGKPEELFDPQIKLNEMENLETKVQYWTSKVVFRSADDTVVKNILLDMLNGDIVKTKQPIEQIQMRDLSTADMQVAKQRWDKLIQQNSFTFESQTGESLPSGTPFRLGALLQHAGGGFFDLQRENLGLFYKELFFEVVIPSFKKDKQKKHTLPLPKDDKDREELMSKYVEFTLYNRTNDMTLEQLMNFDVEDERKRLLQQTQNRKYIHVDIPDSFYDNAKFSMELVITDESMDLSQRLETLATFTQLILPNPAVLEDPRVRGLLFAGMEAAGFSPRELGLTQVVSQPQQPQQLPTGGPVAPQGAPAGPAPRPQLRRPTKPVQKTQ